jgi:hypothetical protein
MNPMGAVLLVLLVAASWSAVSVEGQTVADCQVADASVNVCLSVIDATADILDVGKYLANCCTALLNDRDNCLLCELMALRGPLNNLIKCPNAIKEVTCQKEQADGPAPSPAPQSG